MEIGGKGKSTKKKSECHCKRCVLSAWVRVRVCVCACVCVCTCMRECVSMCVHLTVCVQEK